MIFEKSISQVVDENYVYARALHYLGIDFFQNPDSSLSEVCKSLNLNREQVVNTLASFDSNPRISFAYLSKFSLKTIIQYLKHTHSVFVKDRLPYIVHLINHWEGDAMVSSLLPVFVEDFIKHIYEEEDRIFQYVGWLMNVESGAEKQLYTGMIKYQSVDLQEEFLHHKNEDEFADIRSLTSEIQPKGLHERVLLNEIKAFDREMLYHAQIENHIFFPEAVELEKRVKYYINQLSQLN